MQLENCVISCTRGNSRGGSTHVGAIDAVRAVNLAGWLAIVVTNQSGVARGLFDRADVDALHRWMNQELAHNGARIDAFYDCPYHPEAVIPEYRASDHPDREPNPGMLLKSIGDHDIDPAASFLVGDKPSDLAAADAAKVRSVVFTGGNVHETITPYLRSHHSDKPWQTG